MAKHSESSTVVAERKADVRPELKADDPACEEGQKPQVSEQPAPAQIELLLKTVETELIPRLFVSHMMDIPATSPLVENISSQPEPGPWCTEEAVAAFADLCISNDPLRLDEHVTDLLARGVALESVFLHLLEPVARYLGVKWETDELSFLDVHLGLTRLHQLICECETIGFHSENMESRNRSILLTCSPGDDHTFGLTMVADFFRRYGWRVSNLCGLDDEFVLSRLQSTRYSAIGFSLHHERRLDALRSLISRVRSVASNREMIVMVGGNYFIEHPDAVAAVGADVFASNGKEAVLKANSACKISDRLSL